MIMNFAPHIRVSFGGSYAAAGDPPDIWECSVNMDTDTLGSVESADAAAYLNQVHDGLATWFSSGPANMSNGAVLVYVKANLINAAGHYADPTTSNVFDYQTTITGGNAPVHPGTTSVCYGWTSAIKRGPGARGRIFPPNPCYGHAASEIISGVEMAAAAAAGLGLLAALGNPGGGVALRAVIASGKNATNTPITGCRVGSVINTQRSRKNALKPSYSLATI